MNEPRNYLKMEIDAINAVIAGLLPGDTEKVDGLLKRINRLPKPVANLLQYRLEYEVGAPSEDEEEC